MKKILLVAMGLFLMCLPAAAQVIENFETSIGEVKSLWGSLAGLTRIADPSGKSAGVLEVNYNANGGAFGLEKTLDPSASYGLVFWVWLPAGVPDDMAFKVFAQDNVNWGWNQNYYTANNIPKGVWYPLYFDMEAITASSTNFNHHTNKLGKIGVEVTTTTWTGQIYVDNIQFINSVPAALANFETSIGDVKSLWGSLAGLTRIADPSGKSAGVLEVNYNANGGAFGIEQNIDAVTQYGLVFWVWLPASVPADMAFKVFAQDNVNWGWNQAYYTANNIPKQVWYPLLFDMEAITASATNFNHHTNKLGKLGVEITTTTWSGQIYVDNIGFVTTAVGAKWVLADFTAPAAGTMGFSVPNWAPASTGVERALDGSNGVLKLNIDYSVGDGKVAVQKGDVKLYYAEKDTIADEITLDMYVPSDFPSGMTVDLVYQPTSNWDWMNQGHTIADSMKGKWMTMHWKTADFRSRIVDRQASAYVYAEVKFGTRPTYTGYLYFDNLTLWGIPAPQGTLASPALTWKTDTSLTLSGTVVDFVQFDWVDNTLGTEKYNIYMSKNPITDLAGTGVVKFAPGIPHGLQKYAHRPYSTNGDIQQYYYAITATDAGVETGLTDQSKVGPVSVKTAPTKKVKYVANFASSFSLDGVDNEFQPYAANQIIPESAGEAASAGWTLASTDANFKLTFIIDDHYLYMFADLIDDDVNQNSTYQSWQGDAIEFYMGFYDARTLTSWHEKNFSRANGDWRVGFNSMAFTTLDGYNITSVPGLEYIIFPKLTGDGYYAEAKFNLDSLAQGGNFGAVTNGLLFPLKIDMNDLDPNPPYNDTGRSLIVQTGGNPFGGKVDMDQEWLRPSAWGFLEVIDGPSVAVDDREADLPKEYRLYANYPNPFNPATVIRYDLKEEVDVTLKIYTTLGQEVATLVNERQKAGRYTVNFNAGKLASGVYLYTIHAGAFRQSSKMMLLK